MPSSLGSLSLVRSRLIGFFFFFFFPFIFRLLLFVSPLSPLCVPTHSPTRQLTESPHLTPPAFCIGFPAALLYYAIKAYRRGLDDAKRKEKYGYIYRGLKAPFFWFRLLTYGTSFAIAVTSVISVPIYTKVGCFVCVCVCVCVRVCVHWKGVACSFIVHVHCVHATHSRPACPHERTRRRCL